MGCGEVPPHLLLPLVVSVSVALQTLEEHPQGITVSAFRDLVAKGDCGAQSEQCFKNVEAALRAAGASMDDVTKITCFLVNADDYPAYAAVRQRLFPENGPASATVIIKALVSPDFLVEIEATAVVS